MDQHEFRQLVERVKLRSSIEDIVAERVGGLAKRGALAWARCPFHEERTPSFAVDPRKGTWRCYGACGEGGDVLSFVERFENLSFLDALRLLGEACGEPVPERLVRSRDKGDDARLERLFDVLARAERLYRRELAGAAGSAALAYARERGFRPETIDAFGLGWAPEGGHALIDAARAAGLPHEPLLEAGLARRSESGRLYDFFRGRLTIPIRDRLGRTVGFGARRIGDADETGPKYVNTPETPLFHKGRLVYALDRAVAAVRKQRHLVLVEGYTDVMAAHQAGFANVAAVLGTSTTPDHAALVRRSGAKRVTLVFDGDEAGGRASGRALVGLIPLGIQIDVAVPPPGRDPGDLLLAPEGDAAFRELLEGARDWFAWSLAGLAGLAGPGLAEAVDERLRLVLLLATPVERAQRIAELAGFLRLPERALWGQAERLRAPLPRTAAPAEPGPLSRDTGPAGPGPSPAEVTAFRCLIGALLLDNSLIPLCADLQDRCPEGDLSAVFRAVLELYEEGEEEALIDADAVMTWLGDHPARNLVVAVEDLALRAESPEALVRAQLAWLERRERERRLQELTEHLCAPTPGASTAPEVLESIHRELRRSRVP